MESNSLMLPAAEVQDDEEVTPVITIANNNILLQVQLLLQEIGDELEPEPLEEENENAEYYNEVRNEDNLLPLCDEVTIFPPVLLNRIL